MLRSIHFRFILVNVLVVIVSISLTTFLASRMTGDVYRRTTETGDRQGQDRLVTILTDVYMETGTWQGAQDAVEQMSAVTGERISVVDVTGIRELRLCVSDNGDGIICDMANWAAARLRRAATGAAGSPPPAGE